MSSLPPNLTPLQEQAIQLCRDLIRTPSVNGHDPERAVAQLAALFAHDHGLSAYLPAHDPQRPNVVVQSCPAHPPGLLLISHLDTVPVGDEQNWRYAPFAAEIDDGRIYGRGACDTKGGFAAALAAMVLCEQRGIPAMLVGVPDEESGANGTLGVKFLQSQHILAGRGAIYTYPGNTEIIVGHRGVLRFRLQAHGTSFHSGSLAWQNTNVGHNAVVGMAEILCALEQLQFDDAMPGTLFAPYRTVITPTVIRGGSGPGMVPDYCEARVDIRLMPSLSRAHVEASIQAVIDAVVRRRPPLRIECQIEALLPTTEIPADSAVLHAVQAAAQKFLGTTPTLAVSGPANESYLLNGYGIPTCIIGPTGDQAHAADEYVEIESLLTMIELYADVAARMAATSA
ncbi:MAG: M20 family metallopeptidase [Roseiflexaceae bacterium]